jgi:toxin YoeB
MAQRKGRVPAKLLPERDVVLQSRFIEDLLYWVSTSPTMAVRLIKLMKEIRKSPFEGTGKPEPLKYPGSNIWSRRLTAADRIVYLVKDDAIHFLQGRYHY